MTEVFERLGYVPTKEQQAFHDSCQLRDSEIILVTGRAWGRTTALFMEALKNADEFPGIRIVMVGRSKEEWADSIQQWEVLRLLNLRFNYTTLGLSFPNGSVIRFDPWTKHKDAAYTRYGGMELQEVFFDGSIKRGVREYLMNRIRTVKSDIPVLGTRSTEDGAYRIFIGHPLFESHASAPDIFCRLT